MKISFIVTSYNYADYILETIESIKNQTYQEFEIIVVDDFSTDNSVEILKKVNGIKLFCHRENKGQLAAIITGLKEANGEFVSIIDSDDTIMPEYTQTLIDELTNNNVSFVNCNNSKIQTLTPKSAPFGGWFWAPMSCSMFKKEYLNCVLDYKNTHLWKICPDKFLFNLAHLQGNSMIIDTKLVNKREHSRNAGKIKNRLFVNIKNNFMIRQEALKILKSKVYQQIILKSYTHIFRQIINFCNTKK